LYIVSVMSRISATFLPSLTSGATRTVGSLAIGLAASLIGLGLGILLAISLQALFEALGFGLPTTSKAWSYRAWSR